MKILIGYDGSDNSDFAIEDLSTAGLPGEADAMVLTVGEPWGLPILNDRTSAGSTRFAHPTTGLIKSHWEEVKGGARKLAEAAAKRLKTIFPSWQATAEATCRKAANELHQEGRRMEAGSFGGRIAGSLGSRSSVTRKRFAKGFARGALPGE